METYEENKAVILEKISKLKADITNTKTRNVYEKALARLAAAVGGDDWTKTDAVVAYVDGTPLGNSSKKMFYCAILATEGLTEAQREVYSKKVKTLADALYAVAKKQELTPKEQEKFIEWKDILKVRDTSKPEDADDFFAYQDFIILCLYTMLPPLRADYAPMLVFDKKQGKKEPEGNYMVLNKKPHIVMKNYKTQNTFGRVEIKLPEPLAAYLEEFWMFCGSTNGMPLLWNSKHEPMNEDNLSERVIAIFEKKAGKRCGISMLRHSYITMRRSGKEMSIREKEDLAHSMLHSTLTNELYRRPDAPAEIAL
jgi:hypothetical protein